MQLFVSLLKTLYLSKKVVPKVKMFQMFQTFKDVLMVKAIKSIFKISEKDHTKFILFFRVIHDVKKKSNIFSYIPPLISLFENH